MNYDICEMRKKLIEWTKEAMSGSPNSVDTQELGEVIDMIKDIYQLEYYCAKTKYYESDSDRMEMSTSAKMHIGETIATLRDMWHDADPDLREKMKKDFSALLQEMN